MERMTYSSEELHSMGNQRTFYSDACEVAFPLGGIGTGNVSLGVRGEFRDWEIFNQPGKGERLNHTFFALYAKAEGEASVSKVLESRLHPPFSRAFGFTPGEMTGLPRFWDSTMKGEYPFCRINFIDDGVPVNVSLEAYTPLIPLNPDDSGIPCVIMRYKVTNTLNKPVETAIAGTLFNAVGFNGNDLFGRTQGQFDGDVNEFRQSGDLSGLHMYSTELKKDCLAYGSMSLVTPEKDVTCKQYWLEGGWLDGPQDFWDDFSADGKLKLAVYGSNVVNPYPTDTVAKPRYGSLSVSRRLKPGEEKEFTFLISWYFPNRLRPWKLEEYADDAETPVIRNHYACLFGNSWDVVEYTAANLPRLDGETRKFHNALFGSTLPNYAIDAIASNIAVLRSPTCIWLENGTLIGWEGCGDKTGCCPGTCTHVWNYAQTIAFLFPSLERSMRTVEFNMETDETGYMAFRSHTALGMPSRRFRPAADGQMGAIIRLYREWKIGGDNEFLRSLWDGAKRALDFAFGYWDSDGDCVLDSEQHNTYDIEFQGPNSLINSLFFAALKAGTEMAWAMGDTEDAGRYAAALEMGSKAMDKMLWSGEYYIQKIDDVDHYKYQYGTGCLADQLFGQLLAHVAGLGYVLPEEHVKKAIHSIFKYNFMTNFDSHQSVQRTYALNDEKGLLICAWPHGGRPRLPLVYADEVWTGIEYQVAAHLIYEGFVDEGLAIVKAVRDRYDGYRRNPWDEVECGHHYARSMSSWAVLIALSGFQCDMVNGVIRFSPKINQENFASFWSTGTAWGIYRQKKDHATGKLDISVEVLYGTLVGVKVI